MAAGTLSKAQKNHVAVSAPPARPHDRRQPPHAPANLIVGGVVVVGVAEGVGGRGG